MKKILLWIIFILSLIYSMLYYIQYKETEKFDKILSKPKIIKDNKHEY